MKRTWLFILLTAILLISCSDKPRIEYTPIEYNIVSVTINSTTDRVLVVCDGITETAYARNVQFRFDSYVNKPTVTIINEPNSYTHMVIRLKDKAQYNEYVRIADGVVVN